MEISGEKKKFLYVTLLVIWYASYLTYFHGQRRKAGGDVAMGIKGFV